MKEHRYLICMGSNTLPEKNLQLGRMWLKALDPEIIFSREIVSEPMFFTSNRNLFHNQLGLFHSALDPKELTAYCKRIETAAGRTAAEKQQEIVKLDVDLLTADHTVLKSADMRREYIREGMKELGL